MKKKLALGLALILVFTMLCSCTGQTSPSGISTEQASEQLTSEQVSETVALQMQKYAGMTPEEIVATLSVEEMASQMVLAAVYNLGPKQMQDNDYSGLLSTRGCVSQSQWVELVDTFQTSALSSNTGIPYIYGNDDTHGVNYCDRAVIFPHNIGIGAANDEELTYQMGLAVADEAKLTHMMWNFYPTIAQSEDPRWGRTYESYGADNELIKKLAVSYTKGLNDGGVIACAKHFFADGNVEYGTGEKSDVLRTIDRGDSVLTDDEIAELLDVYQALVDCGVPTIMVSHSSVNGIKMHENAKYLQYLKNDMGFEGVVVGDWNSVQNTSADTYEQQIINSVNAGVDLLMEVDTYDMVRDTIVQAVADGDITKERVVDAATRIIRMKKNAGLFDDPMLQNLECKQQEVGSDEYRDLACQLVEKSLVLLKNENSILPLKENMTVYVTGPAASNTGAQCGGWTVEWNGVRSVNGATSIITGLQDVGAAKNITFTTEKSDMDKADAVLLVVGEEPYAEWNGDTDDLELCGKLGLSGNEEAITEAKESGKPVIACIVAGRQVLIDQYYDDWDAVVMCYLPGTEGQGIANGLMGNSPFTGKLPSPWYSSIDQIGTGKSWLPIGYGLEK